MAPSPVSPWVMRMSFVLTSTSSIAPTILEIVSESSPEKSKCDLSVVVSKPLASSSFGITLSTKLSSSDFSNLSFSGSVLNCFLFLYASFSGVADEFGCTVFSPPPPQLLPIAPT